MKAMANSYDCKEDLMGT